MRCALYYKSNKKLLLTTVSTMAGSQDAVSEGGAAVLTEDQQSVCYNSITAANAD
jgi:hypothetical protein